MGKSGETLPDYRGGSGLRGRSGAQ